MGTRACWELLGKLFVGIFRLIQSPRACFPIHIGGNGQGFGRKMRSETLSSRDECGSKRSKMYGMNFRRSAWLLSVWLATPLLVSLAVSGAQTPTNGAQAPSGAGQSGTPV